MLSIAVRAGTGRECRGGQFYDCLVETDWHAESDPFQTQCAADWNCQLQWDELSDEERRDMAGAFMRADAAGEQRMDQFVERVSMDLYRVIMEE